MEEKLIEAVFRFPEIYNPAMKEHKDRKRRAAAWRCVGLQVGISEEVGKRTWWNLCNKYRNERLGSTPHTQRPWKFMQLLHFLEPYLQQQPTTSHMNLDCPAADTLSTSECDTTFYSTSRHPADSLQCHTPAAVPFNFPVLTELQSCSTQTLALAAG